MYEILFEHRHETFEIPLPNYQYCFSVSFMCLYAILFYSKLFVGGLSWETTQDNLQRYFSRYGDVIDCVVMKNAESGRSRGFGFVTFADPANVNVVLQNGPHTLDGR